jgi:hypothetical protein
LEVAPVLKKIRALRSQLLALTQSGSKTITLIEIGAHSGTIDIVRSANMTAP